MAEDLLDRSPWDELRQDEVDHHDPEQRRDHQQRSSEARGAHWQRGPDLEKAAPGVTVAMRGGRRYGDRMMKPKPAAMLGWLWRQFRRLPHVLQWCLGAACLGSIAMPVLVGDIGIAAMGTAIGLSGALVGAVVGVAGVLGSWATAMVFRAKRQR